MLRNLTVFSDASKNGILWANSGKWPWASSLYYGPKTTNYLKVIARCEVCPSNVLLMPDGKSVSGHLIWNAYYAKKISILKYVDSHRFKSSHQLNNSRAVFDTGHRTVQFLKKREWQYKQKLPNKKVLPVDHGATRESCVFHCLEVGSTAFVACCWECMASIEPTAHP